MNTGISFIVSVAIAATLVSIIIILTIAFLYYRWRCKELVAGFAKFIKENALLHKQMDEMRKQLESKANQ